MCPGTWLIWTEIYIMCCAQREITLRDSLQKFITLHKARSAICLRLVQNACINRAIAPVVTPRGPKYAKEP